MTRALATLLVVLAASLAPSIAPSLAEAQTCAGNRHCWTVGGTHAGCCADESAAPIHEDRRPACGVDVAREEAGLDGTPVGACDPAALEPACTAGDALACEELGHAAASTDPRRAIVLFERACEAGRAHACTLAGLLLSRGPDRQRGEALLWLACSPPHDPQAGDPVACFHYARIQEEGLPTNLLAWVSAVRAHERACAAGVPRACLSAADLVERGFHDHDHQLARDPGRARALRARACDLGAREGC